MLQSTDQFIVRFAQDQNDLRAAQHLRYRVFVQELHGDGAGVDHEKRIEADEFDAHADHLLLLDQKRAMGDQIIGVYRLLSSEGARKAGGFYSSSEFDLSLLINSGRSLLELGRSCIAADYRGGTGMLHLWAALAAHVQDAGIDTLFGVASFHGADPEQHALPLAYLRTNYLADADRRPRSRAHHAMDGLEFTLETRKAALQQMPALIKAYLRLGGKVGDGAFVDQAFNTVDVCLTLDTADLAARSKLFLMLEEPNA